jgi:hypothetical protein
MQKRNILLPTILMSLSLSVSAQQIYRSTDDEGKTEFSDTAAPDSEEVVIESPNVADPVTVPPPEPPTPAAESETVPEIEPVPEGELVPEAKKSWDKEKRKSFEKKMRQNQAEPNL